MCTHATHLCAGVQKRVADNVFRTAYVEIRPAMESALKSLWVVGKVKEKTLPQSLERLVKDVEEVFPNFYNIFSVQMSAKDSFGNDGYRKVNGGRTLTRKCGVCTRAVWKSTMSSSLCRIWLRSRKRSYSGMTHRS